MKRKDTHLLLLTNSKMILMGKIAKFLKLLIMKVLVHQAFLKRIVCQMNKLSSMPVYVSKIRGQGRGITVDQTRLLHLLRNKSYYMVCKCCLYNMSI
jgi:hypothetical protein